MKSLHTLRALAFCALLASIAYPFGAAQGLAATIERVPNGGIQPQIVHDSAGRLHLLYFKGDTKAGDLYYVTRGPDAAGFSVPIRVNSTPGSAVATGTIRGGQLALGRQGAVHVVWNGSQTVSGEHGAPLLYTKMEAGASAFVPQRNLLTFAFGLDGGAAVAADAGGNVYVLWHARGEADGETNRAIYLARSADGGNTFAKERRVNPGPTGACACCQTKAMTDAAGTLYVAYRAARGMIHRDTILLRSTDQGENFTSANVHSWEIGACPMSSFSFTIAPKGPWLAWETANQVYRAPISETGALNAAPVAPAGEGARRKHPVLVFNSRGESLLAWSEGTSFGKGGSLCWQTYDASGTLSAPPGRVADFPVWDLPAACVKPDGSFVVVY